MARLQVLWGWLVMVMLQMGLAWDGDAADGGSEAGV